MGLVDSSQSQEKVDEIKESVRAELLSVKSLASSMALNFIVDEDVVHVQVGEVCVAWSSRLFAASEGR